ncbi:CHRD domain-containing protein [Rhodoferax sp. PAMC 29310]|uniref:CHRD domain-containing protein n=1 Tax=Rhodoferax sp. PAMC 29310 TaxID=2822760 RepID=UPI001B3310EE|nr:CHRD domain-containing protein [Rhodoferax sp. PAMC 29310]
MKTMSLTLKSAIAAAGIAALAGCSMMAPSGDTVTYSAQLSGASEVPANTSAATGKVDAKLDKKTSMLQWTVTYAGLTGPAKAGHFHGPAMAGSNAGVALPFTGSVESPIKGEAKLTDAQVQDLMAGKWYANIHTAANPGGEIRGQLKSGM